MSTNPGQPSRNPIEWVPASVIIAWLDIKKDTLKKWRYTKRIVYKKINGIILYNKTEIDERLNGGG